MSANDQRFSVDVRIETPTEAEYYHTAGFFSTSCVGQWALVLRRT